MRSQIAVQINEEQCSACTICSSICPFQAIEKDPETGKMVLDVEKCQVCGICYSDCPASAISTLYYDLESLTRYLERARTVYDSDILVLTCKGSAPAPEEIKTRFGVSKYIPLSLPCVGRIPVEFLLKAIATIGIRKIHILACDEDYCRFEKGSTIAERRILVLNLLLNLLGYGQEVITLKRNSLKVMVDSDKCIACGNCVFFCPYDAAKLDNTGVAKFDLEACRGCGLCVSLCPAMALDLEGWEHQTISNSISRLSSEMEKPKILVFRCQWAVFPSLDEELSPNIRTIDLPCTARVDTLHILESFQKGIDGIMIAACPVDDCKQETGSREAQRSIMALKKTLSQIGLEDRLYLCHPTPRYPEIFPRELQEFAERLKQNQIVGTGVSE